jgi:uncharacterized protein YndB with AHSA1/START domain
VILAAADIATPPEGVFGALTTAEEVIRWWGSPETYKTEAWAADLRIGGLWKAEGRGADGTLFSLSGAILELDPPHKFVQTWKSDWDGGHETKLTYRLHAIDGGTRLTLRHAGFVDRPEACQDHANGWEAVLNWLRAHFTPASSSANERFYMCRLMPPRPSFARDMTAEETAVMQEHGSCATVSRSSLVLSPTRRGYGGSSCSAPRATRPLAHSRQPTRRFARARASITTPCPWSGRLRALDTNKPRRVVLATP